MAGSCTAVTGRALLQAPRSDPGSREAAEAALTSAEAAAAAYRIISQGIETRMLVAFNTPSGLDGAQQYKAGAPSGAAAAAAAPASREALALAHAAVKGRVLSAGSRAARLGVKVQRDFKQLPAALVTIGSREALQALLSNPAVHSVTPDQQMQTSLMESLPLIGQPAAAAKGFIGSGCAVAVLDTGADYTQPDLGSCTSPGVPESCRVAFAKDFTDEDDGAMDNLGHGTNVASIVSRTAPGAMILALDVFSSGGAYTSDIFSAVDWVIANHDPAAGTGNPDGPWNVCSMNWSFGTAESWEDPCSSHIFEPVISAARAAGILSAVAAGNDGNKRGLGVPACAPSAVSVGAVYDTDLPNGKTWGSYLTQCTDAQVSRDSVPCFSNNAAYLSLMAPGVLIKAGGRELSGTSMATPHVAGAIAVLRSAAPGTSTNETLAALKDTGRPVQDLKSEDGKLVHPRIDLEAAAARVAAAAGGSGGAVAPEPFVLIQNGANYTNSLEVRLLVLAPPGRDMMCVTDSEAPCLAWAPTASSLLYRFTSEEQGEKRVRVYFKEWGASTPDVASVEDTITYDPVIPTMTKGDIMLSSWSDGGSATIMFLRGARDGGSGVASYTLLAYQDSRPPPGCSTNGGPSRKLAKATIGTPDGAGPSDGTVSLGPGDVGALVLVSATGGSSSGKGDGSDSRAPASVTITNLDPGTKLYIRLCAIDRAYNRARGLSKTVKTKRAR